ncbi:MAG: 23S rRNA (pseudouridine(1915)-N(3))-methyltransferase RlmH [Planctomycetota bacterium]|nr:MAG: 23S rRNA (pseudouridine(1915)-N(3))-methyltransferase RlmH [Planctomycetota bacterium]
MKIKIISFGKPKYPFLSAGILEYENRLKNLVSFSNESLKEVPVKNGNYEESLKKEEIEILKKHKKSVSNYLLVENSQFYSSVEFSKSLENDMLKRGPEIHFFIGSPYGFSNKIKEMIPNHLSISKMTFTHDMARFLLVEQIYRAITIQKNIPYHN